MSNPDAYAEVIESIKKERKRLNARSKTLLAQQREAEKHLYNYMETYHVAEHRGIKKKTITPRSKIQRKKKKEKKKDAIQLFLETGIPDPETFWAKLQATQTNSQNKDTETSTSSIDPMLGC